MAASDATVAGDVVAYRRIPVRRPDDMCVGAFRLHNLRVVPGTGTQGPRLERIDVTLPATVVLELPPQSFGEQAFLAATGPEVASVPAEAPFPESSDVVDKNVPTAAAEALWTPPALPLARMRIAGGSRLAFEMPAATASIPYTLAALLGACRTWPQRRAATALPDGAAAPPAAVALRPHAPGSQLTALELPYRLVTSPVGATRWTHRDVPKAFDGRYELWHTRLTGGAMSLGNRGRDFPATVRAIWSDDHALGVAGSPIPDFNTIVAPPRPFRMALDALDRKMLVQLQADYALRRDAGASAYLPRAAKADRLILTPLGGLLDLEGSWATRPDGVDLEQWRHLASMGRDHHVRVVYRGFLMPFGHAASLVKVTERVFEPSDAAMPLARRVAALRQRFFVVVRERVKAFTGSYHVDGGRTFPFTEVELLTRVTPNLRPPEEATLAEVSGKPIYGTWDGRAIVPRMAFWPMTAPGADFPFEVAATDRGGRRHTFTLPLVFVGETANQKAGPHDVFRNVAEAYNAAAPASAARREAALAGAAVAYAQPLTTGGRLGDPRLPTERLRFRAGRVTGTSTTRANWYPEVEEARVGIRPIQRLLGRDDAMVAVRYPTIFRTKGFDAAANPGEVFLQLAAPWSLAFGDGPGASKSDAIGGLATPSFAIAGLSRVMGPAADLAKITGGGGQPPRFEPATFFGDARILGGILLRDLLDPVDGIAGPRVPKFVSVELPADGVLPERVETRFDWVTTITKTDPLGLFVHADTTVEDQKTTLTMAALLRTPVGDPSAASFRTEATLERFAVNLFGMLVVRIRRLRFTAERGVKPDVAVDLEPDDGILFGGPLEFVNQLRNIIPSDGFSDPPELEVTPSGISAGYSLTIPSVQVGIFALSNASLGARFALPFDARPIEVTFNFSERQSPFSLTVSALGGGGFFALSIGADGVREIEAALEFGAAIAIDLGVASGGVEVKAGVYFHWAAASPDGGVVELTGYVRLHGELSILGLISASLTFNLQLSYRKEGSRSVVWGEATLTIEVDVALFSAEVSVTCRRELGGSEADPTFADLMPLPEHWAAYCLAYAPE